ncbi:hypothetical protein GYMLUDRAFT_245944 [Collybiopsis luxurians FD-317 M1]|uniref:WD40 repeat-like protein n=1 Tax=Collybiopsis luxurians FD-317 M1 TaxID=944289 RepID=A0A0D0B5C7_9AGAR|nr:hypothetical protein GYMLUDRAFT_245944 [Collybiopsis luxurians FD-317 M1]
MFPQKRGHPLWKPKSQGGRLPNIYKQKGVHIGDIGILNEFRRFSYLFNVCHTELNLGRVPDDSEPLLNIDFDDTEESEEFELGSYVTSQLQPPVFAKLRFLENVTYLSSSLDETVKIWDTQTGDQVGLPLKGLTDPVSSVAYSPNGQYVVPGSLDQTVQIWNIQTKQCVSKPLCGHTAQITSVAFSPDGQYVVFGSLDQTVRIWNAQKGLQVGKPLEGHTRCVNSVAYSPDGQYIVSGSDD